jgi:hypothetical protein
MPRSIVVYTIISDNFKHPQPMNISYQQAMTLRNMGIIEPDSESSTIVREGDTTVTVYAYRKASSHATA